jgi:VIT1/CCC1 family predicted Fe2+/Mn2+ transporter
MEIQTPTMVLLLPLLFSPLSTAAPLLFTIVGLSACLLFTIVGLSSSPERHCGGRSE